MPEDEKIRTANNIAFSLGKTPQYIQMRQLCHFYRTHQDYGDKVAKALNIKESDINNFKGAEKELT